MKNNIIIAEVDIDCLKLQPLIYEPRFPSSQENYVRKPMTKSVLITTCVRGSHQTQRLLLKKLEKIL